MKPKDEIEKLADNWSDDYEKGANRDIAKRSYISGYTKCQEDMADKKYTEDDIKETAYFFVSKKLAANQGVLDEEIQDFINSLKQEVDVVCPKCKGVNEYFINEKGFFKCAYTDCQHKF
jgi:hypothetical protein